MRNTFTCFLTMMSSILWLQENALIRSSLGFMPPPSGPLPDTTSCTLPISPNSTVSSKPLRNFIEFCSLTPQLVLSKEHNVVPSPQAAAAGPLPPETDSHGCRSIWAGSTDWWRSQPRGLLTHLTGSPSIRFFMETDQIPGLHTS